jgi:Na+-translocating ferredoxin:NAD+ oxidoreductase RnfA subunit
MKILTQLLITALYTIFVQNIVMTSGLGMSEVMRISPRPRTFAKFAVMISGFSVVTSVLCYFITSKSSSIDSYAAKAVVYGAVLGSVYLIAAFFTNLIVKDKENVAVLGIAALNTLVFAVPYINDSAAYSLIDCLASGFGAGFAFVLAAALIGSGARLIEKNKHIPAVFKGTPAMFFYVAMISLGFIGFTGTQLF